MKHCPKCREEYKDAAENCAECKGDLVDGPVPEAEELNIDGPPGEVVQRPEDSDVVLSAPPEFAQPVALALSRAGIPALVFDCVEVPMGIEGPMQDVLVPAAMYNQALWFCRGFESAAFPGDGDEGKVVNKGEEPV